MDWVVTISGASATVSLSGGGPVITIQDLGPVVTVSPAVSQPVLHQEVTRVVTLLTGPLGGPG